MKMLPRQDRPGLLQVERSEGQSCKVIFGGFVVVEYREIEFLGQHEERIPWISEVQKVEFALVGVVEGGGRLPIIHGPILHALIAQFLPGRPGRTEPVVTVPVIQYMDHTPTSICSRIRFSLYATASRRHRWSPALYGTYATGTLPSPRMTAIAARWDPSSLIPSTVTVAHGPSRPCVRISATRSRNIRHRTKTVR